MRRLHRIVWGVAVVLAVTGGMRAADAGAREPGLVGIVFDNPALAKPVRVWRVAEPRAELFSAIARHDYSVTLRGRLTAPKPGETEFRVESDGGVRLRLDGGTILDAWSPGGAREGRGRIGPGGSAALELDYYHDGGTSTLRLEWRTSDVSTWTPIPAAAFSHTANDRAAVEAEFSALMRDYVRTVAVVANPHPDRWPTLRLLLVGTHPTLRASFPNVPAFTCDLWLYESEMDFLDAHDDGGGRLVVRHRLRARPGLIIASTVTPGPGTLEIVAWPQAERGRPADVTGELAAPNLCWQLREAPAFAAYPDPYAQFPSRCFIFTDRGRTFLEHTARRPAARFPADDPVNNPPWIQIYLPAWADPDAGRGLTWAGISPDRFTATIVGAVSRDGRYLAALANDSAPSISQVWLDCLHNNPEWERGGPSGSPPTWRVKLYVMENDPDALLRRVAADFPSARHQPALRAAGTRKTPTP